MPRPATGNVIEKRGARGTVIAVRVRADGRRHYLTLGKVEDGWSRQRAEFFLKALMADVAAGRWTAPARKKARTQLEIAGDVSRCYQRVRQACAEADAAIGVSDSAVVRLALRDALSALYVAEDALGSAIRGG